MPTPRVKPSCLTLLCVWTALLLTFSIAGCGKSRPREQMTSTDPDKAETRRETRGPGQRQTAEEEKPPPQPYRVRDFKDRAQGVLNAEEVERENRVNEIFEQ